MIKHGGQNPLEAARYGCRILHGPNIWNFNEIYKLLIDKPGAIAQFGVRWGREIALFEMYRTIFEPFNHSRIIYGFDTFSGYPTVSKTEQNEQERKKYLKLIIFLSTKHLIIK